MIHETSSDRPVVVPADPAWERRGQALADRLRAEMGPLALRVEHIGSTAIPGMTAKPVFDLQASVEDLGAAALAFELPLARLGFGRSPYERDHVPAGLDDSPARWGKRLWVRRGGSGAAAEDVNLHVRVAGSPNERLALLFRDWFRSHPESVPAYATFKRTLAASVPDTGTYADVKDPVVDLVVTVAERWAQATGWRP
ncbi:GrpB family protein [Streptomyces sp. LN549]|uniref:GrpB family protein n=1 Tax=Streptomyces sp. LN549 TaxID=3112979 RepID=UPI003711B1E5